MVILNGILFIKCLQRVNIHNMSDIFTVIKGKVAKISCEATNWNRNRKTLNLNPFFKDFLKDFDFLVIDALGRIGHSNEEIKNQLNVIADSCSRSVSRMLGVKKTEIHCTIKIFIDQKKIFALGRSGENPRRTTTGNFQKGNKTLRDLDFQLEHLDLYLIL